jgi:hypothetical protein
VQRERVNDSLCICRVADFPPTQEIVFKILAIKRNASCLASAKIRLKELSSQTLSSSFCSPLHDQVATNHRLVSIDAEEFAD